MLFYPRLLYGVRGYILLEEKGMSQDLAVAMDIDQISSILPHRYPFLLVDRVLECIPESHIKAYKNISVNEPCFQGHFPGLPIMPGVLIIEALAQAGCILGLAGLGYPEGKLLLFAGIEKIKFRRQVRPGDRLELECKNPRWRMSLCKIEVKAFVDGKVVAEGIITAALVDR